MIATLNSDNTSMSFLDVMACALGGMSMLFLILAIMPHQGAVANERQLADQISTIPSKPKPTHGRKSTPKPVLYSIEHPNCEVINQSVNHDVDDRKIKQVVWSQHDNFGGGRRIGYARILANQGATLLFRNCMEIGNFVVVKIKDEAAKHDVKIIDSQGEQTALTYKNNQWTANNG